MCVCVLSAVIQYDMASDAVSYLHRVGRTARMGRQGRVTTLVAGQATELVNQLLQGGVSAAFSRKRSLRRALKKAQRLADEEQLIQDVLAKRTQP